MWLLNDSISSKAVVFRIRKKLNPSHFITMQRAVADPFHHTQRQEMNELHTHTTGALSTFWWEIQLRSRGMSKQSCHQTLLS